MNNIQKPGEIVADVEESGIERIIEYITQEIVNKKKPFVAWGELYREADKILKSYTKPRFQIWAVMEPHVYSISDERPKSKNPKLYEYKLGAVYYYYPVDMIYSCEKALKAKIQKDKKQES